VSLGTLGYAAGYDRWRASSMYGIVGRVICSATRAGIAGWTASLAELPGGSVQHGRDEFGAFDLHFCTA
jgi:hypothetical protein